MHTLLSTHSSSYFVRRPAGSAAGQPPWRELGWRLVILLFLLAQLALVAQLAA